MGIVITVYGWLVGFLRGIIAAGANDFRGDPDDGAVWRNVVDHDGVSADSHSVADANRTEDLSARPNENVVAEHRALPSFGANRHLMFEVHIRPAPNRAIDYHSR